MFNFHALKSVMMEWNGRETIDLYLVDPYTDRKPPEDCCPSFIRFIDYPLKRTEYDSYMVGTFTDEFVILANGVTGTNTVTFRDFVDAGYIHEKYDLSRMKLTDLSKITVLAWRGGELIGTEKGGNVSKRFTRIVQ